MEEACSVVPGSEHLSLFQGQLNPPAAGASEERLVPGHIGDPVESEILQFFTHKFLDFRHLTRKGSEYFTKSDFKKMEQVRVTTLLDLQMWKEEFSSC